MSAWSVVAVSALAFCVFAAVVPPDPAALQAAATPLLALVSAIVLAVAFYDWEEPL